MDSRLKQTKDIPLCSTLIFNALLLHPSAFSALISTVICDVKCNIPPVVIIID